ncbi:hypothetical protein DM01DRAFT_1338017 [Hesseltinella vesiculosa]|uniref:Membrane anchor Opy2 N-terminal domain-containing protein n=1 Tax=Hesseltinella vesiculosa TaxID=101127 RepID=A0A1X2GBG7_9FUNG|nr:hypothetical protein DM01DRAFT_1338017 [Hesseltinella vesiculosa]
MKLLFLCLLGLLQVQATTTMGMPTSSSVVCIQMLCPTGTAAVPTCPATCLHSCVFQPDPCCPHNKIGVCSVTPSTAVQAPSSSGSTNAQASTSTTSSTSSAAKAMLVRPSCMILALALALSFFFALTSFDWLWRPF